MKKETFISRHPFLEWLGRKIILCTSIWIVLTTAGVFIMSATFPEVADFTKWVLGIMFVANVAEKFAPKQATGEIFDGNGKDDTPK